VEVFPRLGYYFIVFRALESEKTRARARATQLSLGLDVEEDQKERDGGEGVGGSIGATNVYIVVFRDGICTVSKFFLSI